MDFRVDEKYTDGSEPIFNNILAVNQVEFLLIQIC